MLQETLNKAGGEEGAAEEHKEMGELRQLLPDIREKVEDAKESQKTAVVASEAIQQTLVCSYSGYLGTGVLLPSKMADVIHFGSCSSKWCFLYSRQGVHLLASQRKMVEVHLRWDALRNAARHGKFTLHCGTSLIAGILLITCVLLVPTRSQSPMVRLHQRLLISPTWSGRRLVCLSVLPRVYTASE